MFIFSNLAVSLDGKIGTRERGFLPLGTAEDLKQMMLLRKRCDAILIGAATLRTFRKPCKIRGAAEQPVNIILSSQLEHISPRWQFFTDPQIRRIIFVSRPTPASRLREFGKSSEVISLQPATAKNSTARQIITQLKKRGLARLLIEGGGGVMWDFVSQNLIDEYHVTLTPKILGGSESPTLVDGPGFSPTKLLNLKLRKVRQLGDELYLTYGKGQRPKKKRV
jgi:riboflavin-specific deaminase-like protein